MDEAGSLFCLEDRAIKQPPKYSPEGVLSSVFFAVLIAVILMQVFGRSNWVPSLVWTEELARWVWVWLAVIGIAEVERTNTHLRMAFLLDMMSRGLRRAVSLVFDAVTFLAVCQLLWVSYKTVMRTLNNRSVTLIFTDAFLYGSFLLASVLILIRIALRIRRRLAGDDPDAAPEAVQ